MPKGSDSSQFSDSDIQEGGDPSYPRHIGVIMDGNGRWAKGRFLPRVEGHRAGAKAVRELVEESRRLGIRYLTLFSFSTENWLRPKEEVSTLMKLFAQFMKSERETLLRNGVRLRAIGNLSLLPPEVFSNLQSLMEETSNQSGMDLILALSYGGREEITRAIQSIATKVALGDLSPEQISQEMIRSNMDLPDVPDPDLIIRTSNEFRVSNFLLWQLAYSEIIISPVLWPDFNKEELRRCLREYSTRVRRFGMTDEQISPSKLGSAQL